MGPILRSGLKALKRFVRRAARLPDREVGPMREVMARLDIDTAGGCTTDVGLEMWGAMRGCAFCGRVGRCAAWRSSDADPFGYRAFCPNAGILDRLPRR